MQGFTIPGSCPDGSQLALKTVSLVDPQFVRVQAWDQDLTFVAVLSDQSIRTAGIDRFGPSDELQEPDALRAPSARLPANCPHPAWEADQVLAMGNIMSKNLSLTYINQLNRPITVPPLSLSCVAAGIAVTASFPQRTRRLTGQTLAVITEGGSFRSAVEVTAAALFGPALIEIMR